MDSKDLDAAFRLLISHDIPLEPRRPYVDIDKARLLELRRLIPGADDATARHRFCSISPT